MTQEVVGADCQKTQSLQWHGLGNTGSVIANATDAQLCVTGVEWHRESLDLIMARRW
jgi:hypothetical protein